MVRKLRKKNTFTKLATGDHVGAFCLSEPEAGSDATSQQTTAIDQGDHYLINGTKNWDHQRRAIGCVSCDRTDRPQQRF